MARPPERVTVREMGGEIREDFEGEQHPQAAALLLETESEFCWSPSGGATVGPHSLEQCRQPRRSLRKQLMAPVVPVLCCHGEHAVSSQSLFVGEES